MVEDQLDYELERLHKNLPFLWKDHDFHVKYFTRDYGMYYKGFLVVLGNDVLKLVFAKETNSSVEPITVYAGKKNSLFATPNFSCYAKDGWYSLTSLIYWR